MSHRCGSTTRLTDWTTVCRNMTSPLTLITIELPCVEAGLNTPTEALRVVGSDKREPSAWGYNWATLFLGDINMGTSPSRSGESQVRKSKMRSWVSRKSDPRRTALVRAYRPIFSSGNRKCSVGKKLLVVGLKGLGAKTNSFLPSFLPSIPVAPAWSIGHPWNACFTSVS
jgi:hypothetical protein